MEETTSSWASRRKTIYLWSTILVLTAATSLVFWKFWYKSPTCFDHLKNGDESGVDCGGSCSLVCSVEAVKPIMRGDPRIFQVYPGVYSLLAFVDNQNIDSEAKNVPYKFQIFDADGGLITAREGSVYLPRNKTSAIFEGGVFATSSKPARITFDISPNVVWTKKTALEPQLAITHSPLLNADKAPSINAKVENKSLENLKNIEIVAIIRDGRDNPIAASRTYLDSLKAGASGDIFFTWPKPFALSENVCEKSSDVVLAIDRSGSMASLGKNPPEPLTSVKFAAMSFLSLLKEGDSAGIVSFATKATIDSSLTQNFEILASSTKAISIQKDGTQYTNIADALNASAAIFNNPAPDSPITDSNKIIILLTDGVATDSGGNTATAEAPAIKEADKIKNQGINIYTIGLGKGIHEEFLKQVAASSTNYFYAPSATDLKSIYQKISTSICKETAARIEIISKILGE